MSGVYWRSRTRTLTLVPQCRLPLAAGSVRNVVSEKTLISAVCFLLEQVTEANPRLRIDHVRIVRCGSRKRSRRKCRGDSPFRLTGATFRLR